MRTSMYKNIHIYVKFVFVHIKSLKNTLIQTLYTCKQSLCNYICIKNQNINVYKYCIHVYKLCMHIRIQSLLKYILKN